MKRAIEHALKSAGSDVTVKTRFCLLLLESQLGGDFSTRIVPVERSPAVNAIDTLFPDLNLEVLVLMEGERNIEQPIHQEQFRKRLNPERVKHAIRYFKQVLEKGAENI